ncbi:hypothetical protein, partial [Nocardia sp. NPDC058497]|uniref:hypothetical protein n=1 Tax=Nocardia sp. NPDC058497 TaxID=3346529 RepID=UPI0036550DAF
MDAVLVLVSKPCNSFRHNPATVSLLVGRSLRTYRYQLANRSLSSESRTATARGSGRPGAPLLDATRRYAAELPFRPVEQLGDRLLVRHVHLRGDRPLSDRGEAGADATLGLDIRQHDADSG